MKYFNKLILCTALAAAFGANAATYTRVDDVTTTLTFNKDVQIGVQNTIRVQENKTVGGVNLLTVADKTPTNLYIGVAPASSDVNNLKILDSTGTVTLTASMGCGGGGSSALDTSASGLQGNNTVAATCTNATSLSNVVSAITPQKPAPGTYTFVQEYGTFTN